MTVEIWDRRSTGTSGGSGTSNLFGDGSDGDVTISVNTTITRDMYYRNLTINDTIELKNNDTDSGTDRPTFRIHVQETLTVDGFLHSNGLAGNTSSSPTGGAFTQPTKSGTLGRSANGNGGGNGGAAGLAGSNGVAGANLGSSTARARRAMGGVGGAGGSGGTGNAGATGPGVPGIAGTITLTGYVRHLTDSFMFSEDNVASGELYHLAAGAGGGGGSGGGGGTGAGNFGGGGGGGGSGGGFLWVAARDVIISGTGGILADGGVGGDGADGPGVNGGGGGGGGAGGGGVVILIAESLIMEASALVRAAGGSGGTGGSGNGTGSDGSPGSGGVAGKVIFHDTANGTSAVGAITGPYP